jgi:thiamine biosynthesis lipoprotein
MGTEVHIVLVGADASLLDHATDRIAELERRWSRFLSDSEINALNRNAGRPVRVSAETRLLVERSVDAWRVTGGVFDPTVLGDMLRAGYDRSFETIGERDEAPRSDLVAGADGIRITDDEVCLPEGSGFDPGGIGKGLAADLVTGEIIDAGAAGICVNIGGDVRVAGAPPEGDAWTIDVLHPDFDAPIARLGVRDGAVATSTTLSRRWTSAGEQCHHLIDTSTGRPSDTRIEFATVVSGLAWTADVLAKTVVLGRDPAPFALLERTAAQGLVVDREHNMFATAGLRPFMEPAHT